MIGDVLMAWYAELKRRKWYCINGIDMMRIYKQKLYDDWYNSLTDEQKQRLEEYRKAKAEKRKRDAEIALARLEMMFNVMNQVTHGRMGDYMESARLMNNISLYPSKYW